MKSVEEAAQEILAAFTPLGEERLPLLSALGRFTSEPLHARSPSPGFDNSAMDGYAVRSADLAELSAPVSLALQGESRAGGPAPEPLVPGTAMRIFTGAALPSGADAVVMQEDVALEGERVRFGQPVRAGQHVRRRGSDFAAGALLLPARAELGSGELALLASQDMASVRVLRRPRVSILCTGDELRDIGEPERPGSVVNSNAYGLAAQVLEAGAEPLVLPPVPDQREAAAQAIRAGLSSDVLVLSGGVSVGEYDVVRDALADAGVQLDFWKVRMKPGKPVSFGRAGGVPVLGLPGNPVSTWITFELFVRPGLRRMLGSQRPFRPRVPVRLTRAVERKPGRTEFARARLLGSAECLYAELSEHQTSGALSSLAGVDALVVFPAECARIEADTVLEALILRPLGD